MSDQANENELKIERGELFTSSVDEALAKERAGRTRIVANAPPVSPVRRLLLNPLFYLPAAALLGALAIWLILEPQINDWPSVRGDVVLVNADPFDAQEGIIAITVGETSIYVDPNRVKLAPGAAGEPAFSSIDDIAVGTRIEAAGMSDGTRLIAAEIRPTSAPAGGGAEQATWPLLLLFPLTAAFIAFGLLFAEGLTTRNWIRMLERTLLGSFLAALFATLAFVPAGLILQINEKVMTSEAQRQSDLLIVTMRDVSGTAFVIFAACRSAAWACIGAATGLGMNLARATRTQLRNSVIGGALGGALGGLFFDPIDRWIGSSMFGGGGASRLVGLLAVGLSIGIFVALVDRLAREAWLRVRTGPLAGKSFILYKTPTVIGSAPQADVYLYKDADIDASHVSIHRVGTVYEIEDMSSRTGTTVGGNRIRRRRLASGDQIVIGSTVLDFEERQKTRGTK
jgi:Inner membrane component of T3SS, cytoplasmic domain